jgi:hypothetical protein
MWWPGPIPAWSSLLAGGLRESGAALASRTMVNSARGISVLPRLRLISLVSGDVSLPSRLRFFQPTASNDSLRSGLRLTPPDASRTTSASSSLLQRCAPRQRRLAIKATNDPRQFKKCSDNIPRFRTFRSRKEGEKKHWMRQLQPKRLYTQKRCTMLETLQTASSTARVMWPTSTQTTAYPETVGTSETAFSAARVT